MVTGGGWVAGECKRKCKGCQDRYTCRHARGLHLHFALPVTLYHDAARQWPRTVWTASPRSASCLRRQKTHRRLIPVIVMSSLTGIPTGGAVESADQSMEFASARSSAMSSMLTGLVRGWLVDVFSVAAREMSSSWRGIWAWRTAVYETASSVRRYARARRGMSCSCAEIRNLPGALSLWAFQPALSIPWPRTRLKKFRPFNP